ncbi:MAG: ABC transporter permease [Eubacteriales bacterium]|nr:ABC transporter permease [Eubacteriales bacterium]MDD3082063.1 ABC transporter permease [Desulfobacterales bacterium]MDD3951798.1 ABC transporter permease [Desulfobacterales bacterium]
MNDSVNPLDLFRSLFRNRQLLWQMTQREVVGRYRGSVLGMLWSFFNPIFMLAIYTFVFSVVFQARWGHSHSESKTEFAVILFAGLIVFTLFAEVVNRAPGLILGNVSYVKKVVFPLEILPVIAAGSALFHTIISVMVLLAFHGLVRGVLPVTVLLLPVVLLPLLILILGLAWFLASLGVFLRDVGQTIGIFTTALLFLSPVFYPVSALPEGIRRYLFLNPLTFIIEQTREVLLWGNCPDWCGLAISLFINAGFAWAGLFWFQKTRRGFADVL